MTEMNLIIFLSPKVIIATICGMLIGWERELKNKTAGVRTHVLICVGVTLFTAVPWIINQTGVDPTRVIGQIITGIGFLGAGVIFKQDEKIYGVTSAAFIWFISAIGVIIGLGYLLTAVFLTTGLLVMSQILQNLENKFK